MQAPARRRPRAAGRTRAGGSLPSAWAAERVRPDAAALPVEEE